MTLPTEKIEITTAMASAGGVVIEELAGVLAANALAIQVFQTMAQVMAESFEMPLYSQAKSHALEDVSKVEQ